VKRVQKPLAPNKMHKDGWLNPVDQSQRPDQLGINRSHPVRLFQRCSRHDGELPRPGAPKLCCSVMRDGNVLDRFKLGSFWQKTTRFRVP
jgi:hypothetical protein